MEDMNRYWDTWAPFLSYYEDNMLDVEGIRKLAVHVIDPVLVIGAGQGLLVEQLLQKGFKTDGVDLSTQMIKYAKERRNINLIHADARELPFADCNYKTVILATGVVDLMDDEQQIAAAITEARRVTHATGKTFLAFYRFPPEAEKLMKYMGLVTEDGYWRNRRFCQYSNMRPWELLAALKGDHNVGLLRVLSILLKSQMSTSKKGRRAFKRWALLWKKLRAEPGGIEPFIAVVPEASPYRREPEIRSLFERLNEQIQQIISYDGCAVVLLSPKIP